jgi:hypothetical protein
MAKDDTLFKLEFFVESSRLGEVYKALAGKVRNMSAPIPVINAQANGKDRVAAIGRGELIEMFIDWLRKHKLKDFRASDARAFLEEHGRSHSSYSYLFDGLRDAGLATRTGNMMTSVWHLKPAKKKKQRDYAAERARAKARQAAARGA